MTDKMVNGILFIIAGLGSIVAYIALGETGLLDTGHTEKFAAYALLTLPIAFMMIKNVTRNTYIDAGLMIIVVGLSIGLVSDAINSAELGGDSDLIGEAIAWTGWSIMYLGISITGIGYLRTDLFPNWLSGLLTVASFAMFAFLAFSTTEILTNNGDNIVPPLWGINSLVLVVLGIFTMRRKE
ncbi:MAG: hypothetical protein CL768_03790 [Chloroflexi bacterium]|nr:hypothetical protein [Chloroflexota bacterium]|tara:strand:+ start:160 stop:708 length:549 start_codon:yes stop_codon:yes gene_type:complete